MVGLQNNTNTLLFSIMFIYYLFIITFFILL